MSGQSLGDADHLADRVERGAGGDVLDELALAPVDDLVHHRGGVPLDRLDQAAQPRPERLADQLPVPLVLRRVHVQDRQAKLGQRLVGLVLDERAAELRGESLVSRLIE